MLPNLEPEYQPRVAQPLGPPLCAGFAHNGVEVPPAVLLRCFGGDCSFRCGWACRNAPAGSRIQKSLYSSIPLRPVQPQQDQPESAGSPGCSSAATAAATHGGYGCGHGADRDCSDLL